VTSPRKARAHERLVGVLAIGFCLGALTATYIAWRRDALRDVLFGPRPPATVPAPGEAPRDGDAPPPSPAPGADAAPAEAEIARTAPSVGPPDAAPTRDPAPAGTDLEALQRRDLRIPIDGVARAALQSGFDQPRGEARHEAIDILAPRHTPVRAVEDGIVAKLFTSVRGGITVYQFDPTGTYCYYYAHLERYADGLQEGQPVRRGQVIGYVGTSGNAPKTTPHLHFAIFRLTNAKRWWEGTPIDPYDVLR
jgi:murein DD-endopeptidase MepM/ murein hydrolase activator NlpD